MTSIAAEFGATNPDVYFGDEYLELHAQLDGGTPEKFRLKHDLGSVQYSYVRRPVTSDIVEDRSDIITPYGYGEPMILSCPDRSRLKELVSVFDEEFRTYCRNEGIVSELVRFSPLDSGVSTFGSLYDLSLNRQTVVVDLRGEDVLLREFDKKTRWRARKNLSLGIEVTLDRPKSLQEFVSLYESTMKRNRAADFYLFDQEYFEGLADRMGDKVLFAKAYFENKLIAAAIFLLGPDRIHYHLSGSDYQYSDVSPTTSILHEVALWGIEHRYKLVHLGGGRSASSEDSLFKFKRKFGSTLSGFYLGKRIHDLVAYSQLSKERNQETSDFFPAYRARI
ncbi:peptidoglycan bridge formation glycyltransferase FemA/FemB family protein [Flaviflexus huanghaiensis]|uniref:peptidoglycan bridge formation glycyltransferase FemA/FemB family protein n=1 Tax=Flaviflexus huanghaiensis TaxID=1111473 RepID=UPI0015FA7595|nr:peptidoglycan bridge formation glycyltransferase FemA/FemB family protein [Flaviflexus huanghaiensis]